MNNSNYHYKGTKRSEEDHYDVDPKEDNEDRIRNSKRRAKGDGGGIRACCEV